MTSTKEVIIDMDDGSQVELGVSQSPMAFSDKSVIETHQYSPYQKKNLRRLSILGISLNEREFIKFIAVVSFCVIGIVMIHFINEKYASQRTKKEQETHKKRNLLIAGGVSIIVIGCYLWCLHKYFYIGSTMIMLSLLGALLVFGLELSGYYEVLFHKSLSL